MSDTPTRSSTRTSDDPETSWSSLVPTPEIVEFLETARVQLASLYPFSILRSHLDGAPHLLTGWETLVAGGYTSIGLPEDQGGFGGMVDLVTLLEEAGRAMLPVPLLVTAAATQTLIASGSDLDESGSTPTGVVVGSDEIDGGNATWSVFDGDLVTRVVAIRPDSEGVRVTHLTVTAEPALETDHVDPSRPFAAVRRQGAEQLDEQHLAGKTVDHVLAGARTCVAADLVGIAQATLEGALSHALVREQFGRTIGSFQAVKHLLADLYVAVERARSLTLGSAVACAIDPLDDAARRSSMLAKAAAADAATRGAALQVQLFGAMGLTFEADPQLAVRRAQQTARFLGSAPELYAGAGADVIEMGARG